tara:strand:- start:89 stop:688 length:600 start_codon:yes stop_codon:yes gene_type:complete
MKDFINVYDNAVSSDDCKFIINLFDDISNNKDYDGTTGTYQSKGCIGQGEVNLSVKNCSQLSCNFNNQKHITNKIIFKSLNKYTPLYIKDNRELELIRLWNGFFGYNIQKYNPKEGFFGEHCENGGHNNEVLLRMLSWMIYFNTVTDDGGTYFTNYDRTIDAIEGRLVISPAFWTHTHRGIVSNTQTKYIATGWYVYNQ